MLFAVAFAAAGVAEDDDIAGGGEDLKLVKEGLAVLRVGAAVDFEDGGILLSLPVSPAAS